MLLEDPEGAAAQWLCTYKDNTTAVCFPDSMESGLLLAKPPQEGPVIITQALLHF